MKFKTIAKKLLRENVYYIFFVVLIFVSCVWNLNSAVMPYCVSDEIGYWTAAAWINGVDWSPLMSHSQYYGWGYGILLSVIFGILDPISRFRLAIIINAILLIFVFFFLNKICNLLLKDNDKKINIFISGMATCYSYNILFAHTNMCEVFLTFLFVLNIYIFLKILERPKQFRILCLGILILLQFATHLRTLVCIIALCIVIVFMYFNRQINKKITFEIFFLCFGAIVVVYYVKTILIECEYTSSYVVERLTANEGSNVLSRISGMFSVGFWHEFIYSLEGKLFYLLCSTSFFIIGALGYLFDSVKQYLASKNLILEAKEDIYLPVKIYICLCFLGALAVDTIYTLYSSKSVRLDAFFYGRYVENVLPILICMGCHWIIKKGNDKRIFLCMIFLFSFFGNVSLLYVSRFEIKTSIPLNIAWFSGWLTQDKLSDCFYYTIYPLLLSSCLAIGFNIVSRRNIKIACIIITISWIISAEKGWMNVIKPQFDRMSDIINTACELKRYEEPYLCVIPESLTTDVEEFVDVSWLQYQLGASTLHEINADELERRKEDICIIVNKKNRNYNFFIEDGIIVWSNSRFSVIYHQAK